jgi:hypothetical protein
VVIERQRHPNFPCDIWAAYRATDYDAQSAGRQIVIRVGERSAAVDRALARGHASRAVYVTAWNPHGRRASRHWNTRALARLRAAMRAERRRFIEGHGRGHDGRWPPEASLLVFGVSRAAAAALGRRLRQNAVVFVRRGARAELLRLTATLPRRSAE